MEHEGAEIKLSSKNYWCITCAAKAGLMVTADVLIWDEVDLKLVPLCAHCDQLREEGPDIDYTFSEN